MVNESRLGRGCGEEVTYLELMGDAEGIFTTVVYALDGDEQLELTMSLLEIGIEELRGILPSMEESARLRLVSRVFPARLIEDGPLSLVPLYKLLVLFVRLLFDGGPFMLFPLGGLAADEELPDVIELLLMPGSGILLGLVRRGVSGNFSNSLSCKSCADSVELLC
mgnify:CR=1 FL=1